jgi:hypothetical protein
VIILALLMIPSDLAFAHGIGGKDASFVAATKGPDILPFMYLGAKHMVTGYDHLLFILGVIFFLYRMRDVVIYVTLFSIGHSITLLSGVLLKVEVNAYMIDAVIGLSVAYKAFDNLGGFKSVFGFQPNNRIAVALRPVPTGARHKPEFRLNSGLLPGDRHNIQVELGQMIALAICADHCVARTAASSGRRAP